MDLGDTSAVIAIASMALYVIFGTLFLVKGWPIRAGLAMAAASLVPLTWQTTVTDSDAPGFAFLLVLMLPLALVLTLAGIVIRVFRKLNAAIENNPAEKPE